MTVTIGARGRRSASSSASSVTALATSALTNSVVNPNSDATRLIVSASRRWLMETMMPTLMQVPMTCATPTFIMLASSLAVTNSVSFSTLLPASSSAICSIWRLKACSRFSLRYLAEADFCLLVRRASVSFTCFETSPSLSSFFSRMRRARSLSRSALLPRRSSRLPLLLEEEDWPPTAAPALLMSTRSLPPMRFRFFF